jgi:hypothetical protein
LRPDPIQRLLGCQKQGQPIVPSGRVEQGLILERPGELMLGVVGQCDEFLGRQFIGARSRHPPAERNFPMQFLTKSLQETGRLCQGPARRFQVLGGEGPRFELLPPQFAAGQRRECVLKSDEQ